jgi:hypothetical protein
MNDPAKLVVTWNGEGFASLIRADLERNLDKCGLFLVSSWRALANTSQQYKRYAGSKGVYYKGLNPSSGGQFPHKLTGQFQRSLTYSLDKRTLTLEVGSSLAGYPMFLQFGTGKMEPRPWLTLGWDRDRDEAGRIILGS